MSEEIDLQQLFLILRQRIWLIVISTVSLGLIAFLISTQIIVPQYTASASLYVYNNNEERAKDTITSTDLNTSQQLVQTYIVILTSNTVLDKVAQELDGHYTTGELRDIISASAINDTEAFKISVTNADPAAAQKITNAVVSVAPKEIVRVVKAGGVEVIDYATRPTDPSSPNVVRNSMIGALIGLVLSILITVVLEMLNTTVRCEEDLTEQFNLPVLGVIPSLAIREEKVGTNNYGSKESARK